MILLGSFFGSPKYPLKRWLCKRLIGYTAEARLEDRKRSFTVCASWPRLFHKYMDKLLRLTLKSGSTRSLLKKGTHTQSVLFG